MLIETASAERADSAPWFFLPIGYAGVCRFLVEVIRRTYPSFEKLGVCCRPDLLQIVAGDEDFAARDFLAFVAACKSNSLINSFQACERLIVSTSALDPSEARLVFIDVLSDLKDILSYEANAFNPREGMPTNPLGQSNLENCSYPQELVSCFSLRMNVSNCRRLRINDPHFQLKKTTLALQALRRALDNRNGPNHLAAVRDLHLFHVCCVMRSADYYAAEGLYSAAFLTKFRVIELLCDLVLMCSRLARVERTCIQASISFAGLKDQWIGVAAELAKIGPNCPEVAHVERFIPIRNRLFLAHGLHSLGRNSYNHFSTIITKVVDEVAAKLRLLAELAQYRSIVRERPLLEELPVLIGEALLARYLVKRKSSGH